MDGRSRFDKLVPKGLPPDQCWPWDGYVARDGYGAFRLTDGRQVQAHRYALELVIGPIERGMYACHHCDNRPCVNPAHLFVGTPTDNNHDMMRKGRFVSTLPERSTVLTSAQRDEIRQAAIAGETYVSIGVRHGVGEGTVRDIASGRSFPGEGPVVVPGGRKGGRPKIPRRPGFSYCNGLCKIEKPAAEFSESVNAKGRGWCRACGVQYRLRGPTVLTRSGL